ncbi:MAG: outer membrane protein assembly factor BamD [Ignavibacteriales bacterium]|nr:outer membrane protein assembly factor BamD [Ignavibacteriales bacterium]
MFRYAMVCAVAGLLAGCSQDEVAPPRSAEAIFESAMKLYENRDYQEAYDEFRLLTLQYPGAALADDAQYLMGEAKFHRGEYILAAYEYDVVIRSMPTSELVADARYKKALSHYEQSRPYYLEQEETKKAIDQFQAFIEYHPTDPRVPEAEAKIVELNTKLARKEFESGLIYMKMEYYRAAGISFDHVLEKHHDSQYAESAYFKKGEVLFYRKRYREARDVLKGFLERYPASEWRPNAESLLREIDDRLKSIGLTPVQTLTDTNRVLGDRKP